MKHLVILSGAGISAESGVPTFRDSNGLWEGHDVMEVATPQGWRKNRALVLKFYNDRRRALMNVQPNEAHLICAELEKYFKVSIITQNVDNLHQRAGSSTILPIHGELTKARSSVDDSLVYEIGYKDISEGDKCEKGSQLRPHIVWFGESVPLIEKAAALSQTADIFVVVGTSMAVYPAAGLIEYVGINIPKYIIDPVKPSISVPKNTTFIQETASIGMKQLKTILLS